MKHVKMFNSHLKLDNYMKIDALSLISILYWTNVAINGGVFVKWQ